MALFGTDMVQVTTPDGRRITVPSQLAAQFPGLSPALPPQQIGMAPLPPQDAGPLIPSAPMPSAFSPQDHADFASASAPPPPTGPQPVTSPGQLPTGGGPNRPQPITAPGQLPDAGAPNTPPPMTNAGLAKLGNAGVYNAESSALDQKTDAVKHAATAEADEYTKVGNAMAARDAEAQRMLEERARIAADNQKSLDDKMSEYQRNAKAIADTKVDRSIDHPILAAIGVALGAIGTAMKHESGNPALDAMYKAIDRKVAAQMQDIDLKKGALGMQRDMIGMQRDAGRDKLAEFDTRRIAGLDQAARQIETIKTQSQSDRVRANSDIALAGIADERAKTLGNAMGREQQRLQVEQQRKDALQMHAQSVGVQIRGQNIQDKQFHETLAFQQKKEADDLAEKYAALGQKDKAAKAKEIGELGVWDPATGNVMVDPAGKEKLARADSYEAKARQSTDPKQQQKLNEAAAALRESAQLTNAVMAPDKKAAEEARSIVIATQSINDELGTAEKMLSGDPTMFDRAEWAGLKTKLGDIAVKYAQAAGEKVSPRAIDSALEHIINFNPDSMFGRATGKGPALASIKELRTIVAQGTDAHLKGNGIKSGWHPSSPDVSAAKFGGKTAAEIGADEEPGAAGKVAEYAFNPGSGADRIQARQDNATDEARGRVNAKGQSSNYGLAPADDDQLRALIAQDASASHAKHADIVNSIAAPITKGERPSLATGMLRLLRDEKPALYREVLGKLPPEQAKELEQASSPPSVSGLPGNGTPSKLGPDARAAYNQYLRSKGLPEVSE